MTVKATARAILEEQGVVFGAWLLLFGCLAAVVLAPVVVPLWLIGTLLRRACR